jgi:hypothetical protein
VAKPARSRGESLLAFFRFPFWWSRDRFDKCSATGAKATFSPIMFIDVRRKAIRMFQFAPETHSSLPLIGISTTI